MALRVNESARSLVAWWVRVYGELEAVLAPRSPTPFDHLLSPADSPTPGQHTREDNPLLRTISSPPPSPAPHLSVSGDLLCSGWRRPLSSPTSSEVSELTSSSILSRRALSDDAVETEFDLLLPHAISSRLDMVSDRPSAILSPTASKLSSPCASQTRRLSSPPSPASCAGCPCTRVTILRSRKNSSACRSTSPTAAVAASTSVSPPASLARSQLPSSDFPPTSFSAARLPAPLAAAAAPQRSKTLRRVRSDGDALTLEQQLQALAARELQTQIEHSTGASHASHAAPSFLPIGGGSARISPSGALRHHPTQSPFAPVGSALAAARACAAVDASAPAALPPAAFESPPSDSVAPVSAKTALPRTEASLKKPVSAFPLAWMVVLAAVALLAAALVSATLFTSLFSKPLAAAAAHSATLHHPMALFDRVWTASQVTLQT